MSCPGGGIATDGRMPDLACPRGVLGCRGENTIRKCCSRYCRVKNLDSSFRTSPPTCTPKSPVTFTPTSKPSSCIVPSVDNGRLHHPLACECGVPGCMSTSKPMCCSGKCKMNTCLTYPFARTGGWGGKDSFSANCGRWQEYCRFRLWYGTNDINNVAKTANASRR
jgi:hypothetical protein